MTNHRQNIGIFFILLLIVSASCTTMVNGKNNVNTDNFQNAEKIINNTLFQRTENTDPAQDASEINDITKKYWAVLIGINDYPGDNNDLPYSVNEITSFQNTLLHTRNWKQSNIKILTDTNATNSSLINAITWLDENEDSNDVSLIYFAGHGSRNAEGQEYLMLYDAQITDKGLDTQLDTLEGKVIVILDSCKSGGFIEELRQNKRVILTACSKNELTYQDYNLQSGIFGYFLNRTLEILAKSAETAFLFTNPLCVRYSEKLSEIYHRNYTFHPAIYDGTIGLIKIITWRKFLPISSEDLASFKIKSIKSKIWIL